MYRIATPAQNTEATQARHVDVIFTSVGSTAVHTTISIEISFLSCLSLQKFSFDIFTHDAF